MFRNRRRIVGKLSARQSIGGPPGGRASDPYIAMAGNFFHPTHPRTHMHIRLTLLTQIVIFWEKINRPGSMTAYMTTLINKQLALHSTLVHRVESP